MQCCQWQYAMLQKGKLHPQAQFTAAPLATMAFCIAPGAVELQPLP
jgi:hypothetical protein